MTHYTVQFNSAIPELATVSSLEQERFQGTLENWSGTHRFESSWQPVPCSRGGAENAGVENAGVENAQRRRAIEALEARALPQTVWRLWLIVYRTKLTVSLCA